MSLWMPRSVACKGLGQPAVLEETHEVVWKADQPDEAALADDGVVVPRPAGELAGPRRPRGRS